MRARHLNGRGAIVRVDGLIGPLSAVHLLADRAQVVIDTGERRNVVLVGLDDDVEVLRGPDLSLLAAPRPPIPAHRVPSAAWADQRRPE